MRDSLTALDVGYVAFLRHWMEKLLQYRGLFNFILSLLSIELQMERRAKLETPRLKDPGIEQIHETWTGSLGCRLRSKKN